MLDFSLVQNFIPFMVKAAWITLLLSVISIVAGLILGLFVALMKISKYKILVWIADLYLWVIRGTPLLVQLFLVYFGLPQIGIEFSPFTSAAIALGINAGAYIAEIYRGGILAVSKGQIEAAEALGMKYPTIMKKIILPQALKVSIPSLGNQAIIMLKDSSLASLVTVSELMMVSQRYASTNYAFIEFYIVAALFYLLMTTLFTFILNKIEKRMAVSEQ
ncbi:amino acid ABC transporter permease [Pseudogracilibacillus auburnensis]|uniref:Amino acid ABC transporter membrane protein (PAAT family) n=1 Tax=Pseudogracilibacillus auburnensis TaxID=1494959 RepID=A0A2V3W2A2_9BACI|nr:amino acid ABC transporter permease [Pseudogracilibacillus auburnensis]MBO1002773.1 amino acid ABC transporter permease [Pseudogracilibacillus auburnensis]PXW87886.1 amino acid ABC transporter membrane protein (PAAT family) [Pseudogracilibacillus auburnensis]